ncbi:MAG TPA: MFS transporter, partial [Candidatus Saccharimonadales bacterium]|nr:MFS transporter [Candidatus Saccharimonadales bacterium]
TQIFMLQTLFSVVYMALEIPSGYLADRIGRARSIQLSMPIAATGMLCYGLSGELWQFIACELVLAVACSLLSGADTALLFDSLKASGRAEQFERLSRRTNSLSYLAAALCIPLGIGLVHFFGLAATLCADGVMYLCSMVFALKLREVPRQKEVGKPRIAWQNAKDLARRPEIRWLVLLNVTLSCATYIGFWMATPVYESLGIPVVMFGVLLGFRCLWKAAWARWCHPKLGLLKAMSLYALLAVGGFFALASGAWWAVWLILGHDVVQALHGPTTIQRLNNHIDDEHRATLNSVVNLLQRCMYAIAGPAAGFAIDKTGLTNGLAIIGVACGAVATLAIVRLKFSKNLAAIS